MCRNSIAEVSMQPDWYNATSANDSVAKEMAILISVCRILFLITHVFFLYLVHIPGFRMMEVQGPLSFFSPQEKAAFVDSEPHCDW